MNRSICRLPALMGIVLVSLTLFGVENAAALSFLGGGGSGLPSSSLDGNSTGSDTLCTCDKPGAACTVNLDDTSKTFTIAGAMVCKKYVEGMDPMNFFDTGTGICNSSFTFGPVTVTTPEEGPSSISLSVVATSGQVNNDDKTAVGSLDCPADPGAVVCPDTNSCVLNFGGVTDLGKKQWETNLPASEGYDEGQVLLVTYNEPPEGVDTVNSSTMQWRLCHDKFGEFDVPTCEGVKGNKLRTIADGTLIVREVAGEYSPTSLNVREPDDTTNGTMKLNLACQEDFDPGWVVENSIKIGDVAPQDEFIPPVGGCPDAVYTATFSRADIIAQGSEGDSPLQPDKTYYLSFDGLMTTGEDQVYINGAPPINTK